jgi:hypothetical protein
VIFYWIYSIYLYILIIISSPALCECRLPLESSSTIPYLSILNIKTILMFDITYKNYMQERKGETQHIIKEVNIVWVFIVIVTIIFTLLSSELVQ